MTETKPTYQIDGAVIDDAILEQMRAVHQDYRVGRVPGEFTISDYGEAMGMVYARAKKELQRAFDGGRVERHMRGRRSFYTFVKSDD